MPQPNSPRLTAEHLTTIRQNTDWRQLFTALQIGKDAKKSRDHDWWGRSPFKPEETNASFHINGRGWYCHATSQGGGSIELVQCLHPGMNCYDAGRWLLEQGICPVIDSIRADVQAVGTAEEARATEECHENPPIRQDLTKQLVTDHSAFAERGIPPEVLQELGAGYLERPPRKNGRPDAMNRRLVFQIRGLSQDEDGQLEPVILGHIGRATTAEQEEQDGKWWTYAGFKKSLELYNIDLAVLEDEAIEQAKAAERILIVEGPFDVAKLHAAGIHNVVATFGSNLSPAQLRLLQRIAERTGVGRYLFFYDRDEAGTTGAEKAVQTIAKSELDLQAEAFNWECSWQAPARGMVGIAKSITDPAEFTVEQLRWLRLEGII